MLALAVYLHSPRFVEARRKQSDKTCRNNAKWKSQNLRSLIKPAGWGPQVAHHWARPICESVLATQFSAVFVVIVPADRHPNKLLVGFRAKSFLPRNLHVERKAEPHWSKRCVFRDARLVGSNWCEQLPVTCRSTDSSIGRCVHVQRRKSFSINIYSIKWLNTQNFS